MTIDFSCVCGQSFSFPNDAAGAWIQCPKCRRLNQVITAPPPVLPYEGEYTLAAPVASPSPVSLADLIDTFSRERFDLQGREKDLRVTAEDLPPTDALVAQSSPSAPPPTDVAAGDCLPSLEVAAPRPLPPLVLPRVGPRAPEPMMHPGRVALALFQSRNLVVLLFVFGFQVAAHVVGKLAILAFGMPLLIAMIALMLSHFGCIVEETGPEGRDELPGPLRGLGWNDDIWQPFQRTIAAVLICYFPAWVVFLWAPADHVIQMIALGIGLIGSIFFPAVLLTLITSGTAVNLRPDRVIGMMIASHSYFRILLCWAMALVGYVGGTIAFADAVNDALSFYYGIPASLPMLGVTAVWLWFGICAVHYFCWSLGLMYRESHAQFPWVFQCHIPVNRGKGGLDTDTRRAAFAERLDARLALRRFFGQM